MIDYEDLDPIQKQELISASIKLMRVITETWGAEKGTELWETIAATLGPGIKGEIFFGMLTGKYVPGVVTIKTASPTQYIEMIKAVRNATGFGLKEAKDFCDYVKTTGPKSLDCGNVDRADRLAKQLTDIGCEVTG